VSLVVFYGNLLVNICGFGAIVVAAIRVIDD